MKCILPLLFLFLLSCSHKSQNLSPLDYPKTLSKSTMLSMHDEAYEDSFLWLEQEANESTEVNQWLNEQDSLTREHLKRYSGRKKLRKRLKELYYVDNLSSPIIRGDYLFYTRKLAQQEKASIYYKTKNDTFDLEKKIIDPNTFGSEDNISLGRWFPSRDGRFMVYALKKNNGDESILKVRMIEGNIDLEGEILEGYRYGNISWMPHGKGFFYTYLPKDKDEANRLGKAQIRYHELGKAQSEDQIIYEGEGDASVFYNVFVDHSGKYVFLYRFKGWTACQVKIAKIRDGMVSQISNFRDLFSSEESNISIIKVKNEFAYINTNHKAPNYKIMKADIDKIWRSGITDLTTVWTELVGERKKIVIEDAQVSKTHLVLKNLINAQSKIEILDLNGGNIKEINLGDMVSVHSLSVDSSPIQGGEDIGYFAYDSFLQPKRVMQINFDSSSQERWDNVELNIDTKKFETQQVFYPSKDGTPISMFLVHKKGVQLNSKNKVLLYGYGGFNVNMTPFFWSGLYPWLESGGVFALPNLRGGGEYGEDWHKAGMLAKKQNVFDDFIFAAEYLISKGYTSKNLLTIRGGSNGGLLVGTAMAQRPDLFKKVICQVPLLDMLRYHKYGLGKAWIPEYGDPENKEHFQWLKAYSPYQKIDANINYPQLLMMSATNDDRVHPMHARKFVAKLQQLNPKGQSLLRVEKAAGHGGADKVESTIESYLDMYSFMLMD